MKGQLVVSAVWEEEPSREDVCILLRELAQAIWEGQDSALWEGEGYRCTWLAHQLEQADSPEDQG